MTINKPNTEPKAQVTITCLSTGAEVQFFPYDFEFDDIFRPEWGTYDGFGRMDPVMTYKRTSRTANLSFNVVAESKEDAESNFSNLQTLIQGLYPKYKPPSFGNVGELEQKQALADEASFRADAGSGAAFSAITGRVTGVQQLFQEAQKIEEQIINARAQNQVISDFGIGVIDRSPLFKINFMNLLNNDEYVVAVTNFKHKMKFDAADTSLDRNGKAIPGEFNINMAFTILHTYIPGSNLNYGKVFVLRR